MTRIGTRIRELRKRAGLTQEELASRIGVAGSTVASWETDYRQPGVDMLPRLAEALDTAPCALFGDYVYMVRDPTLPGRVHIAGQERAVRAFLERCRPALRPEAPTPTAEKIYRALIEGWDELPDAEREFIGALAELWRRHRERIIQEEMEP